MDFGAGLWREIQDDHVFDGAAVLAFFFLLAVFPAAIFLSSLLPSLAIPHLRQAILDLLHQVLPEQSANFFEGTFGNVASKGAQGLLTFGLIITLWSGSTGVYALIEQLDAICDVTDRRRFWKKRGTAILLTIFFSFLAIASLSLVILGGVLQSRLASVIGWSRPLLVFFATLRWVIIGLSLLLALAMAYRFGPSGNPGFRFISTGNVVASILIALASVAFRFYVFRFGSYSVTYGSLAAIIILMLWMYMAGIAVLVGWEINKLLQRSRRD